MLLDSINSPRDLKQINKTDLPPLAEELRQRIIDTVSKTGGHLASSLGVVELTLVLHYLFNCPEDKIVWDVGHQAYAHKLLTGRRDRFDTLRQDGGISGFPKREESPYDAFDTGHASTAISAALGMAQARDFKGEKYHVLAVVGDGSLTGGLSFEGLNQAGHLKRDLIVVLNDNEMSISPNVGALSAYLTRIMTGERVTKAKEDIEKFLEHFPSVGPPVIKAAKRLEEISKGLFPRGLFFEELGFQYVGPIEGHNITHLLETFENVKKLKGPILVHVITTKGKGYPPAEEDAATFHGAPPFIITSGKFVQKETPPSYTEIFGQGLVKLAEADEKIVAVTAAMKEGTGLVPFSERFPHRFFDVGIAEQHAVTFSAGLAAEGYRPVAAIYSTFLQRAYDQVSHDVCLQNLPLTFALDRAGIVGADGPTHHGLADISYLRHLPNLVLMSPKDENELLHMLKTAIYYPGPAAVRYPRSHGWGVELSEEYQELPIGQAEVLQEGSDVALIAFGPLAYYALEAAELLEKKGIKARVVSARFAKPLDKTMIKDCADKIGNIVTIEENYLAGGFGSAVLETLAEMNLMPCKIKRLGLPDKIIEHGNAERLRTAFGLSPQGIAQTALELLQKG
jgi:1-deoxy-D-xylulose-5-phosphate synthase